MRLFRSLVGPNTAFMPQCNSLVKTMIRSISQIKSPRWDHVYLQLNSALTSKHNMDVVFKTKGTLQVKIKCTQFSPYTNTVDEPRCVWCLMFAWFLHWSYKVGSLQLLFCVVFDSMAHTRQNLILPQQSLRSRQTSISLRKELWPQVCTLKVIWMKWTYLRWVCEDLTFRFDAKANKISPNLSWVINCIWGMENIVQTKLFTEIFP